MKMVKYFSFLLLVISCYQPNKYDEGASKSYERFIGVSSDEVNIVEHPYNHCGGVLHTIQRINGKWELIQRIDLDKIVLGRVISSIVFNKYWLALGTYYEPNSDGKVFIFKRNGIKWEYYTALIGEHSAYGDKGIAIFRNQLLCGDSMKGNNGVINCYDLTTNPPSLTSTITPPESILHQNMPGFGNDFIIRGNILLALDSSATFTEDDARRYALTPYDLESISSSNGIELPPMRSTYLVFQWNENHWEFVADLFHLLPHPDGGILRDEHGMVILLMHTGIVVANAPILTDDKIYLRSIGKYFVMRKTLDNQQWCFMKIIEPPFPLSKRIKVSPTRTVFEQECIVIDNEYTVRRYSESYIEILNTRELDSWKPIWLYTFPDSKTGKSRFELESGINIRIKNIAISNNIIVTEHFCPELPVFNSNNKLSLHGGITILEVDPSTGPKEVFSLEAYGSNILEKRCTTKIGCEIEVE